MSVTCHHQATDPHTRASQLISDSRTSRTVGKAIGVMTRKCPHLADEFESQAWLAAWRAAMKYNPDRYDAETGGSWPDFLWVSVTNSLASFRMSWHHEWAVKSGSPPMVSIESLGLVDGADSLPAKETEAHGMREASESRESAERLIGMAPEFTRSTLRAVFLGDGENLEELAGRMGVTVRKLKYNRKVGLDKIRAAIKWEGVAG